MPESHRVELADLATGHRHNLTIREARRPMPLLVLLLALVATLTTPLAAQADLIILARHAEKAAPDGDPGLTAAGELRAQALARTLADVHLSAIITSQFVRTRRTAAPTGQAQGLEPLVIEAGRDIAAHAGLVARAVDQLPRGGAVLVVGHSNTLGPIVARLGGPKLADLRDDEYSTLLILVRGAGAPNLLRTRFGPPDPEGSGDSGMQRHD